MLTKKAGRSLALTIAMPLFFVGCKDNGIVNPSDVAGTYQLTLFRAQPLPVTDTYPAGQFTDLPNGGTVTWTDGTMVLGADKTFVETNNYVLTPTGGQPSNNSFVSNGTYTIDRTTFTLSAPAQNQTIARFATGTLAANTITYQEANAGGTFDSYQYKR
ncbi:MAG TPA: hypothetical protein VE110_06790 [Gemmatimonadaceae bacterium]|jgi:hypothetical protein|nr:hypothetical protein [Gemmatimonadaceae bacterium]